MVTLLSRLPRAEQAKINASEVMALGNRPELKLASTTTSYLSHSLPFSQALIKPLWVITWVTTTGHCTTLDTSRARSGCLPF